MTLHWTKLSAYLYVAQVSSGDYLERDAHLYSIVRVPSDGRRRYDLRIAKVCAIADTTRCSIVGRELPLAYAKRLAKEHATWLRDHGYKPCLSSWFKARRAAADALAYGL